MEYKNAANLNILLNRQDAGPLDVSSVFLSKADLDYYCSKGDLKEGVSEYWLSKVPYPYDGQVIALVENDKDPQTYVLRKIASGEHEGEYEAWDSVKALLKSKLEGLDPASSSIKAVITALQSLYATDNDVEQ